MTTSLPTSPVVLPRVEHGDPDGIPVLLLHGYSDSWRSFEPVLPHLPPDLRAIAVTQRGHGDAPRPEHGYAARDFAADAVAVLDALGIERAVIAGHSMGAWNAQQVAIDHPDRVLGVVLMGAVGPVDATPPLAELAEIVDTLSDPIDPEFAREFQLSTTARPLPEGALETFVGESMKMPARVWQAIASAFPRSDRLADAAAIAGPALLVWGDRDNFATRDEQERLLQAISGARLEVYEGTGHAVHWDEPERVAGDLAGFARRAAAYMRTSAPTS